MAKPEKQSNYNSVPHADILEVETIRPQYPPDSCGGTDDGVQW